MTRTGGPCLAALPKNAAGQTARAVLRGRNLYAGARNLALVTRQ